MHGSSGSCFHPYYPLIEEEQRRLPFIAAVRPTDGAIEVEWYDEESSNAHGLEIASEKETRVISQVDHTVVVPWQNREPVQITVFDETDPDRKSRPRKAMAAPVCGTVVNFLSPEDPIYDFSGNSLCSPCIVKLADNTFLVSMDVYKCRAGQNLTKLFCSDDGGKSWRYLTDLFPCFWGKLFLHHGKLYMLSMTTEYGDLQISCSEDEGKTWSDFVRLFPGSGNRDAGGPHKAPLNITAYKGRLWTAVDFGTWEKETFHASGVLSIGEEEDFLCPENWVMSGFLPFSNDWEGAPEGKSRGCLEGNVLILPDGNLYNLLRYQIHTCTPSCNKAVYLHIDAEKPEQTPEFFKIVDFEGGLSKSAVLYDEISNSFVAIVNRVADPEHVMGRNVLALTTSKDGLVWRTVCDLVGTDIGGENYAKVGVQYPDALIDGEDLVWVQRTACNSAANFHDSNYITFHRFKNFRRYI
ncbi:MAG: exo-alpha-sialidase [Clostridia bacterium]|nr:exo-alpha-sialidase [Clostridia bacterium]